MTRFWVLRLLRLAVTLLACSLVIYGSIYLAPGDALSAITGGRPVSDAVRRELIEYYRLGDPFVVRYFSWLGGVLQGDFGQSMVSRQPAVDLILSRLPTSASLVAYASLLIVTVGVPLGLLAASRGGVVDVIVVASTSALAAVPAFVASAVLLAVFAAKLRLFPSFGSGSGLVGTIYHLTLPAVALALPVCGYVARITRSSILAESSRGYVETALSRGLGRGYVLRTHILRNALVPVTTTVGISIAGLIAGAVVVEQVFSINGLGRLLVQSVSAKDTAVVQAVSLVLVGSFVLLNALVDALYPVLDPRIRKGRSQ